MKDFETYIAAERTGAERRTAAGRSARREKARRRRRGRMVSALAALAFLLSALLLLHFPAEAAAEPQQPVPPVLSPRSQPEAPAPEADENTRIECALLERAQVLDHVTVSHYCICEKCCGKSPDHPAYGITASGVKATPAFPWPWTPPSSPWALMSWWTTETASCTITGQTTPAAASEAPISTCAYPLTGRPSPWGSAPPPSISSGRRTSHDQ